MSSAKIEITTKAYELVYISYGNIIPKNCVYDIAEITVHFNINVLYLYHFVATKSDIDKRITKFQEFKEGIIKYKIMLDDEKLIINYISDGKTILSEVKKISLYKEIKKINVT